MMFCMSLRPVAVWLCASACVAAYAQGPRPQEPKAPFPYEQEEVSFPNPDAKGVTLAGTLTKPKEGEPPFAAVLLISGPGPQDRDETMAGHKPFRVLADYLTRRGLAVLRFDDRGTGKSTGDFEGSTTQDFASDAEAGVRYLLTRSEVNQKHIGLVGHGEGAIIAPMVAIKMPEISFVVLLAGTAVPGDQVLIAQTERAEKAAHIPAEQISADKRIGTALYKAAREGKRTVDIREDDQPFAGPWRKQLARLNSPWTRFFLSYDPAPTLEKVKCPVLALDGSKDMQLDPEQNIAAMKAAFARGGNADVTIQLLPGLNYMFQTADTGLGWEYPTIAETISPTVLQIIGDWIRKHSS
jgi:pimeloyl-ACP methyl ester carboxylesterase